MTDEIIKEYRPKIISHRGAKCEAPENTVPAYDRALEYPIDGIELDVQLTKDDIPVIYHDRTLWKIAAVRKRVIDYSLEELEGMDFGKWYSPDFKNVKMPSLKQVLDLYAARTSLYIEIKSRGWDRRTGNSIKLTEKVINYMNDGIVSDTYIQSFILTFDRTVLAYAMKNKPDWKHILNVISPKHFTEDDEKKFSGVWGVCTNINRLTYKFADRIHKLGKKMLVYSCNTEAQIRKAMKARCDNILTDDPAWLFNYLKEENLS